MFISWYFLVNKLQSAAYLLEEAERNVIGVEAGLQAQGLDMYLILAVGLSDESDILSVEEFRVAWCPSLANSLLKLQRVAAF